MLKKTVIVFIVLTVILASVNVFASADVAKGDVNGDGSVDQNDRMVLARFIAGWDGYDALVDTEAADIDGNGKVTAKDRMILSRYLDGWDGYDSYFAADIPETPEDSDKPIILEPDEF